jgi:hypothetical protein
VTFPSVQLGLRENLAQFGLLVAINAFVGAMIGLERSTLAVAAPICPRLLAPVRLPRGGASDQPPAGGRARRFPASAGC